ncbi:Uncharacterised protein [Chlamydia trachomatis]|nr:Uncharacterised protein [Chlamydia trachomatis]CRH89294.1 Uncharacterised protein [Chlamydia trachomatis]
MVEKAFSASCLDSFSSFIVFSSSASSDSLSETFLAKELDSDFFSLAAFRASFALSEILVKEFISEVNSEIVSNRSLI